MAWVVGAVLAVLLMVPVRSSMAGDVSTAVNSGAQYTVISQCPLDRQQSCTYIQSASQNLSTLSVTLTSGPLRVEWMAGGRETLAAGVRLLQVAPLGAVYIGPAQLSDGAHTSASLLGLMTTLSFPLSDTWTVASSGVFPGARGGDTVVILQHTSRRSAFYIGYRQHVVDFSPTVPTPELRSDSRSSTFGGWTAGFTVSW